MRTGLIQQEIAVGDKAANFRAVERLVDDVMTTAAPPDLIVLPELWSTGYALAQLDRLASAAGDEEAEFLGSLARRYNVWFAGGSVAAKTESGITNRAQIIDRDGKLQNIYDKIHLVPMLDEHNYLVAGNKRCIHRIEGIVFGFAICYDIRFCSFINRLALDGAAVLIVSAEWPLVRLHHWQSLLTARAIENQCYVLAANNAAQGDPSFAAYSVAHAPDGSTLWRLEEGEGFGIVEINRQEVTRIREAVPVFKGRRPELYEL